MLIVQRGSNETFISLESRVMAKDSNFNLTKTSCKILEIWIAFRLLANSSLNINQRIAVLAASSNGNSLGPSAIADEPVKQFSYTKFVSVFRQCDKAKTEKTEEYTALTLSSASKFGKNTHKSGHKSRKREFSPAQLTDLKSNIYCHRRGKYGHCNSDHNSDGRLKPEARSSSASM